MDNLKYVVPKVLCLIRKDDKILATAWKWRGTKYYRPPGGHIELYENSKDALIREIMEEFNSKLKNIRFLGVLENIFEFQYKIGKRQHEYDFIYAADFASSKHYEADKIAYYDNRIPKEAFWMSLKEIKDERSILVPKGIDRYVKLLS